MTIEIPFTLLKLHILPLMMDSVNALILIKNNIFYNITESDYIYLNMNFISSNPKQFISKTQSSLKSQFSNCNITIDRKNQ